MSVIIRGATALLVAPLQRRLRLAVPSASLSQSAPINAHDTWQPRSVDRKHSGDQREDTKLLQHLQLCQHGEFLHVSVSERQRLRLCGQNVCGAFVRLYWQPTSKRAIEQWRPTARQKRLYLHHQGEFQHKYYAFV